MFGVADVKVAYCALNVEILMCSVSGMKSVRTHYYDYMSIGISAIELYLHLQYLGNLQHFNCNFLHL